MAIAKCTTDFKKDEFDRTLYPHEVDHTRCSLENPSEELVTILNALEGRPSDFSASHKFKIIQTSDLQSGNNDQGGSIWNVSLALFRDQRTATSTNETVKVQEFENSSGIKSLIFFLEAAFNTDKNQRDTSNGLVTKAYRAVNHMAGSMTRLFSW